ncbi:MAG: hypothetical protein DRJ35_04140 [Thermoprotei archaeon]|nr:MAG: hypothetical protein DRJ35_04140 [Thermoprotei archaeon]
MSKPLKDAKSLKFILIAEAFLAYIYVSLTNGIFLAFLSYKGYNIQDISIIALASSLPTVTIGFLAYKRVSLIAKAEKKHLLLVHASERLIWLLVPFLSSLESLLLVYTVKNFFSALISLILNNIIFSSFNEEGVKEVTSKRNAFASAASIIGFLLATFFLTLGDLGFLYSFISGTFIGLVSTGLLGWAKISRVRTVKPRKSGEERIFVTSLYQILYSASVALQGVFWVNYLILDLGSPAYWPALIGVVATFTSVFSSLYWGRKPLEFYKVAIFFDSLTPIAIFLVKHYVFHLGIAAYGSTFGTGAGFLGSFLYARYLGIIGPTRASSLLILLGGLGQLIASVLGIAVSSHLILVAIIAVLRLAALLIAFLTIPEVSIVPAGLARTYAVTLYMTSLQGYRMTLEFSYETVMTTIRILILTLSLLALYTIYRVAVILMEV